MSRRLRFISLLAGIVLLLWWTVPGRTSPTTQDEISRRGYLLWGSDAEGGAPYVFPDPKDPSRLIGFEVDLAEAIAREMGVKAKQVQNAWDSLIPGLERGDYDIVMNGLEVTPQRAEKVLFSMPYYAYAEQLVVRKDAVGINGLADLKGKKVGTLSGTVAQDMLSAVGGIDVKIYSGQVEPYEDLAIGRIDAVLLDLPIAAYYGKPNPKLRYAGPPVGEGLYGIAMRKTDGELKKAIDSALTRLIAAGEVKRIYEKWDLWTPAQEKLLGDRKDGQSTLDESRKTALLSFVPALLKGAGMTVILSATSMCLAISLGLLLAVMKMFTRPPFSTFATAYIELYRGTPLLIQLYILYYGLPNVGISLSPLLAAFLGLGMNYAAYEAEIYRGGIMAVPRGQMEAALSLGMSQTMALRRIVLPQALRFATPGVTNDFIALFKDSSLVSVIALVELTKTYTIYAATTLKFFELGIIVAILYFGMSYPLSLLARRLEARLKGAGR